MDLITLDSPFISDPTESPHESDREFKDVWDGLQSNVARGWCESSVDTVVQRLRSPKLEARVIASHLLPFEGEHRAI
jgi:AP-4 complex subunit epsilon-1